MKDVDPYQILGLDRDCQPSEIRTAYHRLSKTLHPDVGGGEEQFKELSWAYNLLSNPKLRDQYDRTGNGEASEEAMLRDEVLMMASQIVSAVLAQERDEDNTDVIAKIQRTVHSTMGDLVENVANHKRRLKKVRKLAKRIKRKKGNKGPDLIANMMKQYEESAERSLKLAEHAIVVQQELIKLFAEYTYDSRDEDPENLSLSAPPAWFNDIFR